MHDITSARPHPCQSRRQADIVTDVEGTDEVEVLEDNPDVIASYPCEFRTTSRTEVVAGQGDTPAIGGEETAQAIQQRRLACPRGPDDGNELARINLEIDPLEHFDPLGSFSKTFAYPDSTDQRRHQRPPMTMVMGSFRMPLRVTTRRRIKVRVNPKPTTAQADHPGGVALTSGTGPADSAAAMARSLTVTMV